MKGRRLLAAVILAVLAGVLLALPAAAQSSVASSTALAGPTILHTQMTGEQEVPPGDPNGFGSAHFALFPSSGKICYTLTAFRIAPANAAHIHEAPVGVAGDVVVTLRPPTFGISGECTSADPELVADIAANPSEYYVNVHNIPYPAGAIRGQLHY